MPTRLRKVRRQRGSRTHGWGQVTQHRRTGAKGGSGMAGLHKHKWSYLVKYAPDHFGSNRFRPPNSHVVERWVNLTDLPRLGGTLEGGTLDLASLGYQKLLGGGRVDKAYEIRVPTASASAVEKIKAAGGSILLTLAAREKEEEAGEQRGQPGDQKIKGKGESPTRQQDNKAKGPYK